ncbi:hypothetical protein BJX68DRAFT_244005 [Aspergillus pseudodeflectus]|uniref:Uncharacterized protein n=1 Tax=Aspergillus pseudodeflectus TaxID=176178 RepID=A0ABR4JTT1_9EURO
MQLFTLDGNFGLAANEMRVSARCRPWEFHKRELVDVYLQIGGHMEEATRTGNDLPI